MALTYSKYLQISHQTLISKGVYNGALDQDYKLHIDPLLIKTCDIPEFKGAYEEFITYFKKFIILAPLVKAHNFTDKPYRQILQGFYFPERANTGLGYSKGSTHGKGISGALSHQLAESAIEIIEAGFKDPAVFALLPLFEEKIGADRISDMTISILFERFLKYTHRITKELNLKSNGFRYGETLFGLPSYRSRPIVFIPMALLTELPQALDFDDIDRVCDYNRRIRKKIAQQIGLSWEEYSQMKKKDWKKLLMDHPQYLNEAIDTYKQLIGVAYDFSEDIDNKYSDARLSEIVDSNPLNLLQFVSDAPESMFNVTMAILTQFKSLVEKNYMWKIFNRRNRTPDETDWQLYLFSIADTYIKASKVDVDVNRETNNGVGELDFKFSRGTKGKTVVEIKRSANQDLLHGYITQLPRYMEAESAEFGIFVIIRDDEIHDASIGLVYEKQKELREKGKCIPDIILVNACPKATASVE